MSSTTHAFGTCGSGAFLLFSLIISTVSDAGAWATITVNSLADPGAPGICTLRDAITAANTMTATNGCVAGRGNDTIQFSVTGTILLASTLPEVTDSQLTINGPASPGITISGGDKVQVMQVASGATLNLKNATIAQGSNIATNSSDAGGIINDGTLTLTNSTLSGNKGSFLGGSIDNEGTATVTNSTFSGNTGGGAAIGNSFYGGGLIIINSTFSGNLGGAIFSGGPLTVVNSTFSSNISGGIGGIGNLRANILAGSTTSGNCSGTIADDGYKISDDESCEFTGAGSLNNTDPKPDPDGLANNGGPTQTIALLSGSPAIDAIPLASCTDQDGNPLTTDQRGFPRPDNGETVCDIGAYEFQDFAGDPSSTNCYGKNISALSHTYRTLNAASSAMGFRNLKALQSAIRAFCKE